VDCAIEIELSLFSNGLSGVDSLPMKAILSLVLLISICSHGSFAQTDTCCITHPFPHRVRVSAELAEKSLIYKADLVCPHVVMPARVTGTVVVGFDIDRKGNVIQPSVISGPAMLRKPVLDAVRKYKYKPYFLNGKAVEVETIVSVTMDSNRDCHY
jgi:hypothetical protein